MKTLRFGIEIETVGLSFTGLARAIHSGVGAHRGRSPRIGTGSLPRANVDVLPPERNDNGAPCDRAGATEPRQ